MWSTFQAPHSVRELFLCTPRPQPIPLLEKAAAGLTAGGLGAMVGSPADLTLIRMQSDSTLPAASRRNYKGVGDAMVRRARAAGSRQWSIHRRTHCSIEAGLMVHAGAPST